MMNAVKPAAVAFLLAASAARAVPNPPDDYLTPRPALGDRFSNVFSIADSLKLEGFDEAVGRNGGTADYVLTKAPTDRDLVFHATVRYDGLSRSEGENIFRDEGTTQCWNAKCYKVTDASGLLYNAWLWGTPPAHLKVGMTWQVAIDKPWEMGPAGVQTVTVVHLDPRDRSVVLKREGIATGAFANEGATARLVRDKQPVTFKLTPGQTHWVGYTIFRRGIVISDELLVEQTDSLEAPEVGSVKALRRRIMLLNAAPYPTTS